MRPCLVLSANGLAAGGATSAPAVKTAALIDNAQSTTRVQVSQRSIGITYLFDIGLLTPSKCCKDLQTADLEVDQS